jgi:hypothetical protein
VSNAIHRSPARLVERLVPRGLAVLLTLAAGLDAANVGVRFLSAASYGNCRGLTGPSGGRRRAAGAERWSSRTRPRRAGWRGGSMGNRVVTREGL